MSSATETDRKSINSMSFCPNPEEIDGLIAQSNSAELTRISLKENDWRSLFKTLPTATPKLLSKLFFLPGKFGLCPDSLNPDDTILAKLGRGENYGGIGPGGLGDSDLRIINDRNMPLGSTSCGPNGVLAKTEGRMNLFHKDTETTQKLLNEYISFRNKNLNAIFEMFVNKIKSSAETMKLDPSKEETLIEDLQEHYRNVRDMFLLVAGSDKINLSDCGIGCVSFCQTWLRNGSEVGNAQFSVMSPHFQTRFHVTDDDALKRCGVTQKQIDSYCTIIHHFDEIMSKDYGALGGGQAFINLDKLHDVLTFQEELEELSPPPEFIPLQRQGGRYSRKSRGKNKKTKKGKKNKSNKKKTNKK